MLFWHVPAPNEALPLGIVVDALEIQEIEDATGYVNNLAAPHAAPAGRGTGIPAGVNEVLTGIISQGTAILDVLKRSTPTRVNSADVNGDEAAMMLPRS